MKKLILLSLALCCLTACPGEENNEDGQNNQKPDMRADFGADMNEDMSADSAQDMVVDQDMMPTGSCVVAEASPGALPLGSSHSWRITLNCERPLTCVQAGCVTLTRTDVAQTLSNTTFEAIEQDGHWYAVGFEQLQSPPSQPDAQGNYASLGVETMSLAVDGLGSSLDVQVRWFLNDEMIKRLNLADPGVVRLPDVFLQNPLMGLKLIDPTPTSDEHIALRGLLWGMVRYEDRVEVLVKRPNEQPEVLSTLRGNPDSWSQPYLDVFARPDGGYTMYWRVFDKAQKRWVGGASDEVENGNPTAGPWHSPLMVNQIESKPLFLIGQREDLSWDVGRLDSGNLILIESSRPRRSSGDVKTWDLRVGQNPRTLAQDERVGLVSHHQSRFVFWFARPGANQKPEVQLVSGVKPLNRDLQLDEPLLSITLDAIDDISNLQVERLVQPNGVTVGVVFHDGVHATLVQPDGKGQWSQTAQLTAPPQVRLGVEAAYGAAQTSSPSFVLEGHHLVALGRWPWNWRDKLKVAQNSPTFVVQWDIRDGSHLGTTIARRGPRSEVPANISALRPARLQTQHPSGVGEGDFVDGVSCKAVGDCHLLDGLPTGEQLYLKGGPDGPTVASGKYGDILIDGVPLEFDLTRPNTPTPTLASAPVLMRRPSGGAFVVLPVWEKDQPRPTHRLWLMNPDGALIPTKTTIDVPTDAETITPPIRTIGGELGLLVTRQTEQGQVTYQLVDHKRFADTEVNPTSPMTITPMLGTLTIQNAGAFVAQQHGFGQSQAVAASGPGWLSLDGITFVPKATKLASAPKTSTTSTLWMLGHRGADCGALTWSQATELTGEVTPNAVWTQPSQKADCSDAEAILGTGQFIKQGHMAVATYNPKTRELGLMYLVERDQETDIMRATLATLEVAKGKLSFALADVNGDGLTDIVVDGQWSDGVRVVKSGAEVAVVTAPAINYTFEGDGQNIKGKPSPNLGGPPVVQFGSMNSAGLTPVNAGTFTKVVTGGTHTCALRATGKAVCWGDAFTAQHATVTVDFQDIGAGENYACGLKPNGIVRCWGENNQLQLVAPTQVFKSIGVGQNWSCGIKPDDTVQCWGFNNQAGQLPGTFSEVQVGNIACGMRANGTLACWDTTGAELTVSVPTGTFTDFDVTGGAVCGIQSGEIKCWRRGFLPAPPSGTFKQVTIGAAHGCAIKPDDTVECWGNNTYQQLNAPANTTFKQISAYRFHTCGVTTDDRVSCWGNNVDNESSVPQGQWVQMETSRAFTCGRRADLSVVCWGAYTNTPVVPANVQWTQMFVGYDHVCGLTQAGSTECFVSPSGALNTPPAVPLTQIANGLSYGCGLKADQSVECWGPYLGFGLMTSDSYIKIDGGPVPACGIRTDGEVTCWGLGATSFSQNIPAGPWADISIGYAHGCVLDANGAPTCWRQAQSSLSSPLILNEPAGPFTVLSSGVKNTCGLKADGTIECWGDATYGVLNTPAGQFISAHIGSRHACAVRADGTAVCWGLNDYGQLNIPN